VLAFRSAMLNTSVLTVPWYPDYTRQMWPTLLQTIVHIALLAHAPRQQRLMKARWSAQLVSLAHSD
jgi:hypothetical protein